MKTRDLPHHQLCVYATTLAAMELPSAWLDLSYIDFIVWLDLARKDLAGTRARWVEIESLKSKAGHLVQPILEKCPALTLEEAVEMLPEPERAAAVSIVRQLAGFA